MYVNSGYLHNSLMDFMDKTKPLVVGSCGTYRLHTHPRLPTYRPKGRVDYQLIYIAAGKAHFFFQGKEEVVAAGYMVLYRPREEQKYVYYGTEQTQAYWVHFTGRDVKSLLRSYGFPEKEHVFYTGNLPEYHQLFQDMIQELQLCKPHYEELLALQLHRLFILVSRQFVEKRRLNGFVQKEVLQAAQYFSEHYNQEISIEEYAASRNMSTCWFIRTFKQYNRQTPMQYILSIRMANAQSLLETTSYNVTEVAMIVGYENPLYFSRLFKKHTGFSPREYRDLQKRWEEAGG